MKRKIRKLLCRIGLHRWRQIGLRGVFLNPVCECKYCLSEKETIIPHGEIVYVNLEER